jgi:hypothetical protein
MHCDRSAIFAERQFRWGDRQSWTLKERLPHLFAEIEFRIVHARRVAARERVLAERAAAQAKRRPQERERQWRQLMDRARELLVEEDRLAELRRQADAWQDADRLRRYLDALDSAHGEDPGRCSGWRGRAPASLDSIRSRLRRPCPTRRRRRRTPCSAISRTVGAPTGPSTAITPSTGHGLRTAEPPKQRDLTTRALNRDGRSSRTCAKRAPPTRSVPTDATACA